MDFGVTVAHFFTVRVTKFMNNNNTSWTQVDYRTLHLKDLRCLQELTSKHKRTYSNHVVPPVCSTIILWKDLKL